MFVAAAFVDAYREELDELVTLLTVAALAVLTVTTALAWSLAGRIIAPVRQLTRTAKAITHSDLSARIPVEGHNEISELGTTFNEMVDRLERGSRAQRQFLDDIAHDLRTPLTSARGHLETLRHRAKVVFDRVRSGETIDITEHRRPIARITPIATPPPTPAMAKLIDGGRAQAASRPGFRPRTRPSTGKDLLGDALRALRHEERS